jgi:hypothetical protein
MLGMPKLVALAGVLLTVVLGLLLYVVLQARLAMSDFQSLSYGPMVSLLCPVFMTVLVVANSLAILAISSRSKP